MERGLYRKVDYKKRAFISAGWRLLRSKLSKSSSELLLQAALSSCYIFLSIFTASCLVFATFLLLLKFSKLYALFSAQGA